MDPKMKQLVIDYQTALGTEAGKRVLDDLKTRFDAHIIPIGGMPDVMAYQVGQRETFLYIMDKIDADPNAEVQEVADIE